MNVYLFICLINFVYLPIFLLLWCANESQSLYIIYRLDGNSTSLIPYEVSKHKDCCALFLLCSVFTIFYINLFIHNENNFHILEECLDVDWNRANDSIVWKMTMTKLCLVIYTYLFYYLYLFMTLCTEKQFVDNPKHLTEEHVKYLGLSKLIVMSIWIFTVNSHIKRNFVFITFAIVLTLWYEINVIQWYNIIYLKDWILKILVWTTEVLLIVGMQGDVETAFMTFLHCSLIYINFTSFFIQCLSLNLFN
jgi:hypothetical protein